MEKHNRTKDGRILINLKGINRFQIDKEIKNNEPYREFLVNYNLFKNDKNLNEIKVSKEKLNELINNSKIFFQKQGILLNWKELSKLSVKKQIYNLAMISPISVEEKQKLIEIVAIDDVANILNEITKFSFYEDPDQKKILQ